MRSNDHNASIVNFPRRGHGRFNDTRVDGLIYGGRPKIDVPAVLPLMESFSRMVPKGSVRKDLRHFAGALGFENVNPDELNSAVLAIKSAKSAKRNWYNQLTPAQQETIGALSTSQDATKSILTLAANRSVGLDATFGILDVGNDAAIKVTTLNSLNRLTGGKLKVNTIQDRDVKATLEGMSNSSAYQLTQSKHWGRMEKSVSELCAAVGTSIQNCVYSKIQGLPGATEKVSHFIGSINPGSGRVAAEPVLN